MSNDINIIHNYYNLLVYYVYIYLLFVLHICNIILSCSRVPSQQRSFQRWNQSLLYQRMVGLYLSTLYNTRVHLIVDVVSIYLWTCQYTCNEASNSSMHSQRIPWWFHLTWQSQNKLHTHGMSGPGLASTASFASRSKPKNTVMEFTLN